MDFPASLADWHKEIVPFPTGYATFVYAAPSHRLVSRCNSIAPRRKRRTPSTNYGEPRFLVIFPRCHTPTSSASASPLDNCSCCVRPCPIKGLFQCEMRVSLTLSGNFFAKKFITTFAVELTRYLYVFQRRSKIFLGRKELKTGGTA